MPAALLEFASVNDAAAATASKLKKQAILAEYLARLDETDLRLAVRFAAGRPFAATDERVLNVGWRAVTDVILALLKLDPCAYHDLVVRSGEIGEALASVWPAGGLAGADEQPLVLGEIALAFGELAQTGQAVRKREILTALLSRCIHPRTAFGICASRRWPIRPRAERLMTQASPARSSIASRLGPAMSSTDGRSPAC